jgi:DNA-binding LytR/AlgR family response regulator
VLHDLNGYVCVSDGVKFWLGPLRDVMSLEQTGNYCKFTLRTGQKFNIRGALCKWEEKLPTTLFFRTGRNCIVNLSHVKHMVAYDAKRFSFIMPGDDEVILSRSQSVLFRRTKSL